ncbi:esterase [Bryobacter aggregatus]|uniref:esterase n=1 Tax=Bryobacter aggregatus TaxID=360054 RepID=UPI000563352B|nr:alpha/beta hydrolase-fold protein [Bryobacter aggregatus]
MHRLATLLALTASFLLAQPQPQPIFSPVVHANKTVTFNLRAPNATKVDVALEGNKPISMTKDEKGIWSATSDTLRPDIYGYSFRVDGISTVDPINGDMKSNALNPSNMFLIPGDTPEPWELTDIPHGTVHHHFFNSKVAAENRDFFVYTPPNYDASKRYPLLVLLHGYSDLADGWTTVGKANLIFDRLISNGKKPFIAVMPLGYGMSVKELKAGAVRSGGNFVKNTQGFETSLMNEVLPIAEKQYKVSDKANERAIAGLSMGGAETLFVGLRHIDRFAWIGAMSSAPQLFGKPEEAFPTLSDKDNARIKLLWIACGTSDGLLKNNQAFVEWLKTKNITNKYVETEGAHTWLVWRRYLTDFMNQVQF